MGAEGTDDGWKSHVTTFMSSLAGQLLATVVLAIALGGGLAALSTAVAAVGGVLCGLGVGLTGVGFARKRTEEPPSHRGRWLTGGFTALAAGLLLLVAVANAEPTQGDVEVAGATTSSTTAPARSDPTTTGPETTTTTQSTLDPGTPTIPTGNGGSTSEGGNSDVDVSVGPIDPAPTTTAAPGRQSVPVPTTAPTPTTTVAPVTTTTVDPRVVRVYGTGDTGLTIRAGPSTNTAEVGRLPEGTQVVVTCQTAGDEVVAPAAGGGLFSTRIWDRVNGGYVSDAFVTTKGTADFTPGIPRC